MLIQLDSSIRGNIPFMHFNFLASTIITDISIDKKTLETKHRNTHGTTALKSC